MQILWVNDMSKFFSAYNRPPSKPHCACPRVIKDYIKDSTTDELVEIGTIPFYERIQSHHDSCTLSSKLKRFAYGDTSAIPQSGGFYGDFTQVPTDLRAILDARKEIIENFGKLGEDVRAVFGNDFEQFEQAVRDGTAERKIYDYNKSKSSQSPVGGSAPVSGQAEGGAQ